MANDEGFEFAVLARDCNLDVAYWARYATLDEAKEAANELENRVAEAVRAGDRTTFSTYQIKVVTAEELRNPT